MEGLPIVALIAATALLWAKFVWATMLQGKHRLQSKTFQYPEDAENWGGTVFNPNDAQELSRADRAQNMLRNDSEGQIYFFVLALIYVWMGCFPRVGALLMIGYALARWVHGITLIFPKQPLRNRAFSIAALIQLIMLGILFYQAFQNAR